MPNYSFACLPASFPSDSKATQTMFLSQTFKSVEFVKDIVDIKSFEAFGEILIIS